METSQQTTNLDPSVLAAELAKVRRYGVRRRGKEPTPTLEAAARILNENPDEALIDQIVSALETAAKHMPENDREAVTAVLDLGPVKPVRFLKLRRRHAAERLQCSVKYFEEKIEKELLKELAGHLVRLAEEEQPPSASRPVASTQPSVPPRDEQDDSATPKLAMTAIATTAAVKMIADELREVRNEGLARAISTNRVPLLTKLAEAVMSDADIPAQQTRRLLVQVIGEVEQDTVIQAGLVELLELSGAAYFSLNERRQRSRRNLFSRENELHDPRSKPHRQEEKEERICKTLAQPLAAMAMRHGIIQ